MEIYLNDSDDNIVLECLSEDYLEWASKDKRIAVSLNESGGIVNLNLSVEIHDYHNDISSQIIEQYQAILEKMNEGVEFQSEGFEAPFPYDPERIRVEPYTFSIKQVAEMIDEGDLQLNPDFQRHFVWRSPKQKSRLVESVLLRIPLPVFYLSQDDEGFFQVIDGLQRLTVLWQFFQNRFSLKGLEYLKDLEGCTFSKGKQSLPLKYKRRVERTQLNFNVIDPQTPTRVKFEIFKRINQGGKALNYQEIRNCMAKPRVREFIKKLASSEEFQQATTGSVSAVRMADHELILRFIGFYLLTHDNQPGLSYNGTMSTFLDDTLDALNKDKGINYEHIYNEFADSMVIAKHVFGKYAFRKYLPDDFAHAKRRKLINNSLFTSFSVVLTEFKPDILLEDSEPEAMSYILANELKNDRKYYESISFATSDAKKIDYSMKRAMALCEKYL